MSGFSYHVGHNLWRPIDLCCIAFRPQFLLAYWLLLHDLPAAISVVWYIGIFCMACRLHFLLAYRPLSRGPQFLMYGLLASLEWTVNRNFYDLRMSTMHGMLATISDGLPASAARPVDHNF